MMTWASAFFVVPLILGARCLKLTELITFDTTKEVDHEAQFMFHPAVFYGSMGTGEDPGICLNLTSSSKAQISIGSCIRSFDVGGFETDVVFFNKTMVDLAMKTARQDANTCHKKPIGIFLNGNGNDINGTMQLFRCTKSKIWRRSLDKDVTEITQTIRYEPAVTTWNDRRWDAPFYVAAGERWSVRVGLGRAVDSAIMQPHESICFSVHGVPFVNIALAKCKLSTGFDLYVKEGTTVALNKEMRASLSKLKKEKCDDETVGDDWWLRIMSDNKTSSGYVTAYACTEKELTEGYHPVYLPSSNFMGYHKKFNFAQRPLSESTYSADLNQILEMAAIAKDEGFKLQLAIQTTTPVSIFISRCSYSGPKDRIVLAKQQSSGVVVIGDIDQIFELSKLPKCETTDSDEALYLKIRSNLAATGELKFNLKHSTFASSNESKFLRTTIVYNIPKKSFITRELDFGKIFDETFSNVAPLGLWIHTTSNVTVTIAKCSGAQRHVLLENVGSGVHRVYWNVITSAVNMLSSTTTCNKSPFDYHQLSLRIESVDESAQGSLRFVSVIVNGKRNTNPQFVELKEEFRAVDFDQEIVVDLSRAGIIPPQEIDLRLMVEIALADPQMKMTIESDAPITINFGRCVVHTENDYDMVIPMKRTLDMDDLQALRDYMKYPRCSNQALNGLFVHSSDPSYEGTIRIFLDDIRTFV